ncbi:similar to periplasmic tail-specific protease [Oleispira antarctica RB-8]|uniref:Similar to periplasmic tail-specific protease n=1 Tax=Oleispira antarctica RB-8 TaxID=698738 RepID=R4YLV7_OLEAN|nr:similar to periplasmic tail-specific protease [Oleispira antarctica RB-8]
MKKTRTLFVKTSAFLSLSLFAAFPASATIPVAEIDAPFQARTFTQTQVTTSKQSLHQLLGRHYEKQRLNDDLSSKIYDLYLKSMDGTHSYFLASDIEEFEKYRLKLDDGLIKGNLDAPFAMYNRLQQRVTERLSFLLKQLPEKAKAYDFSTDEKLSLDRENVEWSESSEELDDLWRKRLKNSILNLRLADKEDDDIYELLSKRYHNQLNRTHLANEDDGFQVYMNSVTHAFDPHTAYFSPRNTENFNINMSLSLQGIGAVLQTEDEHTKVVRLVPAGPADKAGQLQTADKITGVGQGDEEIVDVIGWRLDEVVDLIRGAKGTTVRLEIIPSDANDLKTKIINIVRDEVKLEEQSAQKEIIEIPQGDKVLRIGVIDIPTFYIDFQGRQEGKKDFKSTTRDVERLVNELKEENVEGIIVDLRNNGGGSLDEALNLTDLFIDRGPVVQVRYSNGYVQVLPEHKNQKPGIVYDGPIAVLTNRLSASASEIFAGAIQDYGRGIIVGGQTFGKGTVQSVLPLEHGQLKLTQAKFYRVSGDSTQHQGVIPDILFPSLFDKEKIGESALDEALAWDTIRPAGYKSKRDFQQWLPVLRESHQARIETNPDFIYLHNQKELMTELRQRTDITLNEKQRKQEREDNKKQRLDIENKRRKAKGMELLTELKSDDNSEEKSSDKKKDAEKKESKNLTDSKDSNTEGKSSVEVDKETEEEKEPDALLLETGNILVDLMSLGKKPVTEQQQAQK